MFNFYSPVIGVGAIYLVVMFWLMNRISGGALNLGKMPSSRRVLLCLLFHLNASANCWLWFVLKFTLFSKMNFARATG